MNLTLYTLANEYRQALDVLVDSDHDLDVIRDTLDGMLVPVEEKAGNVAAFVLNIEAEAEAVKTAEQRLKARREALEHKAKHLRDYIQTCMETCAINEITGPDSMFRIKVRMNPEKVELDDSLPALPAEYWREKTTREPDKPAILAALKAGQEVPGARIVRTQRLEIK